MSSAVPTNQLNQAERGEIIAAINNTKPMEVKIGENTYNVKVTKRTTGGRRKKTNSGKSKRAHHKRTHHNKRKGTRRNKRKGTRRNKRN